MLENGTLLDGKYRILAPIGRGGMSVVYLARNEKANKQWAVKEIRKDGTADGERLRQHLVAETEILKKLRHPCLPSIVDIIDTQDTFIVIMDYIEGRSLGEIVREQGALPQESVVAWGKQLCDVLGYLHSRRPPIIHRDIKPDNIMLKPDGNITVLDFGTAREYKQRNTRDTRCLGTPGYAPREQFGIDSQTDARTDIYGLGATMHHLLTGVHPGAKSFQFTPIRQINPALSPGLEVIISKCTREDPAQRYQSAAELMYDLEHYPQMDGRYREKLKRRLRVFCGAVGMTAFCACICLWGYGRAKAKRAESYGCQLQNAREVQDYYNTILTDPVRTEAYLGNGTAGGLIRNLLADGVLTADEKAALDQLRAGLDTRKGGESRSIRVLEQLKQGDPEGYQDVCCEIGEAILFYYQTGVDKDRYVAAAAWFSQAGERHPEAGIYCDIAGCLEKTERYARSQQFQKLHQEYASLEERMEQLLADADGADEDLKLRVWREITALINTHGEELAEASSREALEEMLGKIEKESAALEGVFLQEPLDALRGEIALARRRLATVNVNAANKLH